MLTDAINTLNELKEAVSQESCTPKEPFIKLGTGNAPMLNYNIPQSTCFSTYGNFKIYVKPEYFQDFTKEVPKNNIFEVTEKATVANVANTFNLAGQLSTYPPTVLNATAVKKFFGSTTAQQVVMPAGVKNLKSQQPAKGNVVMTSGPVQQSSVPAGTVLTAVPNTPVVAAPTGNILTGNLSHINASAANTLVDRSKAGSIPIVTPKFGGFEPRIVSIRRPVTPTPYFVVIEEYKTCSFLGDYGAGRTVKTFSLLPGEKTTISVRTYKDVTSTKSRSETVLDSFSESSASELENMIQDEYGEEFRSTESDSSSTSVQNDLSTSFGLHSSFKTSASGGISGIFEAGVSMDNGFDMSRDQTMSIGHTSGHAYSGSRAKNVSSLHNALNKHVAQANTSRNVEVNTSTSDTASYGEENTTIRELVNYNKSRVLNFVWRQLIQEFVTLTSLVNIKIGYCNGYPESLRVVNLESLDDLLKSVIKEANIDEVRKQLLAPYCEVLNYDDDSIPFIESYTHEYGKCLARPTDLPTLETFYRRAKGLSDTYTAGGLELTVKGVILKADTYTLRTDSMVVDALLGQGEALDCYNKKAQDAASIKSYLEALAIVQQIQAVEDVEDPIEKANAYKKIFGNCCDTPQTQIIS